MTINHRMALIQNQLDKHIHGNPHVTLGDFKWKSLKTKIMTKRKRLAIDINSIKNFEISGRKLLIKDILQMYEESGHLIYNGRQGSPPMILDDDGEIAGLYDSNTEEGKSFMEKYSIVGK